MVAASWNSHSHSSYRLGQLAFLRNGPLQLPSHSMFSNVTAGRVTGRGWSAALTHTALPRSATDLPDLPRGLLPLPSGAFVTWELDTAAGRWTTG